MNNNIVGIWELDPKDYSAKEIYGEITIEFKNNGKLIYSEFTKEGEQIIIMNYQIIRDKLITDQPSHPKKKETQFILHDDGKLELSFEGVSSMYVRKVSD
jgi:hypothetical protein